MDRVDGAKRDFFLKHEEGIFLMFLGVISNVCYQFLCFEGQPNTVRNTADAVTFSALNTRSVGVFRAVAVGSVVLPIVDYAAGRTQYTYPLASKILISLISYF